MYTFFDSQTGCVFTSPNTTNAPPPTFLQPANAADDLLQNLRELRLMSARFPHLPYALRRPLRTGSLFSCLHCNPNSVTIVGSDGNFILHPDLLAKWLGLDKFLSQVFRALPVSCPPNAVFRPVPSDAEYGSRFQTEEAARKAVARALQAFQHLIALCSWVIAPHAYDLNEPAWVKILLSKGLPPAMVEMLRNSPVARFSLHDPRVGTVVDVNNEICLPYVRDMVDAQVPVYVYWGTWDQYYKPVFKRVGGSVPDAEWINANCYPSETLLRSIANTSSGSSVSTGTSPEHEPPSAPVRIAPRPLKGSGQKHGETWQEFFTRRSQAYATIAEKESASARNTREQRIKCASARKAPGRKGTNVFYWEEQNGFRIRTPIGYKNYIDLWSKYQGEQLHYDSFADEWDLCSEFDPDAMSECSDDDSDDTSGPFIKEFPSVSSTNPQSSSGYPQMTCEGSLDSKLTEYACQPLPTAEAPPPDQPISSNHSSERHVVSGGEQLSSSNAPVVERPMSPGDLPEGGVPAVEHPLSSGTLVVERPISPGDLPGGGVPTVESSVTSSTPPHSSSAAASVDHPMSVDDICEGEIALSSSSDPQVPADADPASIFVGDDIPECQAPSVMQLRNVLELHYGFNYSPSSMAPRESNASLASLAVKICEGGSTLPNETGVRMAAADFLERLTTTQPLDTLCDMSDGSLVEQYIDGHITIRQQAGHHISVDGIKTAKTFYLVIPRTIDNPPFIIIFDDPVSALYLIRAQLGPEPSSIAKELVHRGIPFSTRVALDVVPTSVYTVSYGLGFLPYDYSPHSSDYVAYLEKRDDMLRRNYGRAALLKGGIIGRLARESLGGRADFVVASGPSDDAIQFGSSIRIEGLYYWDDDLDCEDEDIICGVYKLSTGQRHNHYWEQTADVSWWPKQSIWETCGLNVGYWSTDDEVWYQKHLQKIRDYDGTGPPPYRTATDWRNALKYRKETKKVRSHISQTARNWFTAHA